MPDALVSNAGSLHWDVLIGSFVAIGLWETLRPFRRIVASTPRRWLAHVGLSVSLNLLNWMLLPASAVLFAASISPDRWGFLNSPNLPLLPRVIATLLLLDLVRFSLHRAFHSVPALWRIHQVHHSDHDLDLTTGFRFHPLEGLLNQAALLLAIVILAPPPIAVLISELVLVAQNFLSHANVTIPPALEAPLRYIFITPHLHRAHHSIEAEAQNSNFGTSFSCWDRLFRSYHHAPVTGDQETALGLREVDVRKSTELPYLLALPFRARP